jgi:transposase
MKAWFGGERIKALEQARRQACREGNLRVVRRTSVLLEVGAGRTVGEVAGCWGSCPASGYSWLYAFILGGAASLRYRCSPGRPSKLTPSQKRRLGEVLVAGPLAAGYPTGCWSAALIQDLLYREFGRFYNLHYLASFLRNLGFSYQKARFVSDQLDPERRRCWREQEWPAILRLARTRGALLLFGDEASFAQWGSLAYTWTRTGQQPLVPTCGKRKAYKVFGLINYFTGRAFFHGQSERCTAASYCAFPAQMLAQTDGPIILVQDGARHHTATDTRAFLAAHADRLTVYQLPGYAPEYNPIEHLWKNMKQRTTHNRYFATFEALTSAVDEGLAYFRAHPALVKQAMGTTLATLRDQAA